MIILIPLFSFILVFLCLFTLLVVMIQKPKGDGGLGAALGGGSMEAALGAETGSLLTKVTIYAVIGFFLLTFSLYLGNIGARKGQSAESGENRLSEVDDESAPAGTAGNPSSDSALQQVPQQGEDSAQEASAEADEEATEVPQEVEATTEDVNTEAEEVANP